MSKLPQHADARPAKPAVLTIFRGRVADRNPLGMLGSERLGRALAQRLGLTPTVLGTPATPLAAQWDVELEAARPELIVLSQALDQTFQQGNTPITTLGRCAASLATLPVVARHHPQALVVWFDAHADSNLPSNSASGYLGGLVLTGAAGLWPTGLPSGLQLGNVVLVGARDIDPAEQALIDDGTLRLVKPGNNLAGRLAAAIGERPVYVHLDCDVLEPGIVPTEYRVEGGLTLADLQQAAAVLAKNEVIGLEISEFQACWPGSGADASPAALMEALGPLLAKIHS
ncbi:MAG TPA: arginase family protein [Rhodoferax sp.]